MVWLIFLWLGTPAVLQAKSWTGIFFCESENKCRQTMAASERTHALRIQHEPRATAAYVRCPHNF